MINNLRWIGVLGAAYVACAAVGTAQAAAPDDRAEARGPGAIAAASTPGPDRFERAVARPFRPSMPTTGVGFAARTASCWRSRRRPRSRRRTTGSRGTTRR